MTKFKKSKIKKIWCQKRKDKKNGKLSHDKISMFNKLTR